LQQTRSALERKSRLANKQKAICKNKGQFERKCSGVTDIVFKYMSLDNISQINTNHATELHATFEQIPNLVHTNAKSV